MSPKPALEVFERNQADARERATPEHRAWRAALRDLAEAESRPPFAATAALMAFRERRPAATGDEVAAAVAAAERRHDAVLIRARVRVRRAAARLFFAALRAGRRALAAIRRMRPRRALTRVRRRVREGHGRPRQANAPPADDGDPEPPGDAGPALRLGVERERGGLRPARCFVPRVLAREVAR